MNGSGGKTTMTRRSPEQVLIKQQWMELKTLIDRHLGSEDKWRQLLSKYEAISTTLTWDAKTEEGVIQTGYGARDLLVCRFYLQVGDGNPVRVPVMVKIHLGMNQRCMVKLGDLEMESKRVAKHVAAWITNGFAEQTGRKLMR